MALVILLVPIVYVLSVGPMFRLREDEVVGDSPWETIYSPLAWLHDHTFLEGPLDWYVELWLPD